MNPVCQAASPSGAGGAGRPDRARGPGLQTSPSGWVRAPQPPWPGPRHPGGVKGPTAAAAPASSTTSAPGTVQTVSQGHAGNEPGAGLAEFSVIIPSRDEGELLLRTVRSVLESEGPPFEVIVVDDGSADPPSLGGLWPNVRQVQGAQLGVAQARNAGADVAGGRFLVFVDAHVLVPPRWLAEVEAAFQADPQLAAVSPGIAAEGNTEAVGYGLTWDENLNVRWLERPRREVVEVPLLPGGCLAVRSEVFRSCRGFNRGFRGYGYDDVELSLRLWLMGYRLASLSGLTVIHRFRPGFPYPVDLGSNYYNLLRMAVTHFNERRIGKVLSQVSGRIDPSLLIARLLTDDTAEERRRWHEMRARDDDWFMSYFRIPF